MSRVFIRSYQVDITDDPPRKHGSGGQWWAVLRTSGALHVRKYLGQIAIQSARAGNANRNKITGPYWAKDAAEARRIAEEKLRA